MGFAMKHKQKYDFLFYIFSKKNSLQTFSNKKQKSPFLVHFGHILLICGLNFPQNAVHSSFLILTKYHCVKLKKTLISRFQATLFQTDGHTHTWTDKHELIDLFRLKSGDQKVVI